MKKSKRTTSNPDVGAVAPVDHVANSKETRT
jgi:hypothetical protein